MKAYELATLAAREPEKYVGREYVATMQIPYIVLQWSPPVEAETFIIANDGRFVDKCGRGIFYSNLTEVEELIT